MLMVYLSNKPNVNCSTPSELVYLVSFRFKVYLNEYVFLKLQHCDFQQSILILITC